MAIHSIFGRGGLLAAGLSGFEQRPGQEQMAVAVAATIKEGQERRDGQASLLLVEAETGVGKTLAYLVPALLSGQRVVVSTATITLQDQIVHKEIPLLEKVLGIEVSAECIKGRANYLCHYRWYQYCSTPNGSTAEAFEMTQVDNWLAETESGDRAELAWLPDHSPLWTAISAQSNQCLGGDCPELQLCFVNRLRRRAGTAQLLIVNHHLFFSDLSLRQAGFGEILPRYQSVIFDEAHHLETVATNFFGKQFSHYQVLDLISDLERLAPSDLSVPECKTLLAMVQGLKQRLVQFSGIFPVKRGRFPLRPLEDGWTGWETAYNALATGLLRVARSCSSHGSQYGEPWNIFGERGSSLHKDLQQIAGAGPATDDHFIRWYERRERTVSLSATPLNVADELERCLYGSVQSCILTSATLTAGGDFKYVRERLGIRGKCQTLSLQSPFDYKGRTLLYVPEQGFPEASAPGYNAALCERIQALLTLSQGRALVLFTSLKAMALLADFLESRLSYPVLVQGRASRHALLEQFRENKNSVLLAVASFWEGVDISGDSLSCVLIDKLPFEVPSDPVIQARMAAIEGQGGKPFFEFQVPRAILTLRQGVGRLMRATGDRGLIAVLDIRLYSKGYGRLFRASLPPSPVVRTLEEVADFFVAQEGAG